MMLDVRMPGMSGLEVLQQLRQTYTDTCVVMLSAVVDVEITASALNLGADNFVTKPYSMDYLKVRIEAAQAERESVRSGESPREVSLDDITKNTLNKGSEGFSGGYWGSFAEILRPPGLFSQMCRPLIALRRGRCNL